MTLKIKEILATLVLVSVVHEFVADSDRGVNDGDDDNVETNETPSKTIAPTNAVYKFVSYNTRKDCEQSWCLGKDCVNIPDNRKCMLCTCPIGSIARGCDKMPMRLFYELMQRGCPHANSENIEDRYPATKVTRYYRKIIKRRYYEASFDECVPYEFPYCPDLDYNMWNSPKTKQECENMCYWKWPETDSFSVNNNTAAYA